MATLLPARSRACNLASQRERQVPILRRRITALVATWLVGCGTPDADKPQNMGNPDAGLNPSQDSSATPAPSSGGVASTNTLATTETTNPETSQTSKPSASTNPANTSATSTATTDPAETETVDDLPPPAPEIFAPEGSNIPPGSGPLGVETTCDGMDDDENGVVDDVDATSDGVCDCLKVATLGLHGEWGDGDFVTGWLKDHVTAAATDLDGEPLSAERLAPFHILLIRDVSLNHNATLNFSAQEANALWTWVRNGGGLMTLIGYSDPDESGNVNSLLEPFGLSYASDQIVQGMGASVPVTDWFEHPLSTGITQVGADNGYPVAGAGITFAAQDDYDVGKALTIGDGHVLVWGDEWVTYEGEWASDTAYQVDQFWKNSLSWLTRATQCKVDPA